MHSDTQILRSSKYNVRAPVDGDAWLVNSLSGGVVKIVGGAHITSSDIAEGLSISERLLLVENGFLIDSAVDELKMALRRFNNAKWSIDVLGVTVAPTLGCNFSCSYCFEKKTDDFATHATMDDSTSDRLVAQIISNLEKRRGLSLRWFGGEPLLATRQMLRISEPLIAHTDAHNIAFNASIQTNGYLLNEVSLDVLSACRIGEAHVSIDGGRLEHDRSRFEQKGRGSYDRVLDNIALAAAKIQVVVRVNVTKRNSASVSSLLQDLASRAGPANVRVYFSPVYNHYNGAAGPAKAATGFTSVREYAAVEAELYREAAAAGFRLSWEFLQPKALPCSALKADAFMVGPKGEVMKCDHEFGVKDLRLGTLTEGVWNVERLARWTEASPERNPYCSGCSLLPACWGNCDSLRDKHADPAEACPSKKFNFQERLELAVRASKGGFVESNGRVEIYQRAHHLSASVALESPI